MRNVDPEFLDGFRSVPWGPGLIPVLPARSSGLELVVMLAWLLCALPEPGFAAVFGETGAAGAIGVEDGGMDEREIGVDTTSGAATLRIPVDLPPGVAGLEPSLSFSYSSEGRNGELGVGWAMPLSKIECSSRFGVPQYGGGECDRFELDGEVLVGPDSSNDYHSFTETFARIERVYAAGPSWRVTTLDGRKRSYGTDSTRRVAGPGGVGVATWYLNRVEDVFGNWISYDYDAGPPGDEGELYLERVQYANGKRQIHFVYEMRPDAMIHFRGGVRRRRSQRLKEIRVEVNGAIHHRLLLSYDASPTTGVSRLVSIQRFGTLCTAATPTIGGGCEALPPVEFEYSDSGELTSDERWTATGALLSSSDQPPWYAPPEARFGEAERMMLGSTSQFADVDGDGLQDLIVDGPGASNSMLGDPVLSPPAHDPIVYLNNGADGWEEPDWSGSVPNPSAVWTDRLRSLRFDVASIRVKTVLSHWLDAFQGGSGQGTVFDRSFDVFGENAAPGTSALAVLGTCWDGPGDRPVAGIAPEAGSVQYAPRAASAPAPSFNSTSSRNWTRSNYEAGGAEVYSWDTPEFSEIRPFPHFQFVDLNADGLADMVMSVYLSGFHLSLSDCESRQLLESGRWVPGRATRVVFMNNGSGWTRDDGANPNDGNYADSLPPFGLVAFESADYLFDKLHEDQPFTYYSELHENRFSPCSGYGLAGQRLEESEWGLADLDSPDFCIASYDLAPVFRDLNGDGYPDLVVTETQDPDAIFHRFYSTVLGELPGYAADSVPFRESGGTASVAWLQNPHPGPGEDRWVRMPAYDPPIDHALVLQMPGEAAQFSASSTTTEVGEPQVFNTDIGVRWVDLNRDGLDDLVVSESASAMAVFGGAGGVLLNRGAVAGAAPSAAWCASAPLPGVDPCASDAGQYTIPFVFGDFDPRGGSNASNADPQLYGDVFQAPVSGGYVLQPRSVGMSLLDLNADGWVDVLLHQDHEGVGEPRAWIHQPGASGSVWVEDDRFAPLTTGIHQSFDSIFPSNGSGAGPNGSTVTSDTGPTGYAILDANGDGVPDLIAADRVEKVLHESWISDPSAGHSDLLSRYRNAEGLSIALDYRSAIVQRDPALEAKALAHATRFADDGDTTNDFLAEPPPLPHPSNPANADRTTSWSARPVLVSRVISAPDQVESETTYRFGYPRRCSEHQVDQGFRLVETTGADGSRDESYYFQNHGRAGRLSERIVFDGPGEDVPRRYEWAEWEVADSTRVRGGWASSTGALFDRAYIGRVVRAGARNEYGRFVGESFGFERSTQYSYDDVENGYNFVREEISNSYGTRRRTVRRPQATQDEARNLRNRVRGVEVYADQGGDSRLLSKTLMSFYGVDGQYTFNRVGTLRRYVADREDSAEGHWIDRKFKYSNRGNLIEEHAYAGEAGGDEARIRRYCYDGDSGCAYGHGSGSLMVGRQDPNGRWSHSEPHPIFAESIRSDSEYEDVPTIRSEFDSLGRPVRQLFEPSDGDAPIMLSETIYQDYPTAGYAYDGAFLPYSVTRQYAGPGEGSAFEWVSVASALEISIQVRDTGGTRSGTLIGSEFRRNAGLRETMESHPYACGSAFLPANGSYDALIEQCLGVETEKTHVRSTLDALGRPLRIETDLGVELLSYSSDAIFVLGSGKGGLTPHDRVLRKRANGGLVEIVYADLNAVRVRECNQGLVDPHLSNLSGVTCVDPDETRLVYEPTGELRERIDPTLDENGYVEGFPIGAMWNQRLVYLRDTLGRIVEIHDPDAGVSHEEYDAFGNLIGVTDARGITVLREYDALDRLLATHVPGEASTVINYDPDLFNRKKITDGAYEMSLDYDELGRVVRELRRGDYLLRTDYEFDYLNRPTRIQYPSVVNGATDAIDYEYAGAFLARVCDVGNDFGDCDGPDASLIVEGVTYDGLGRPAAIQLPGGARRLTYDRNSARRVSDLFESHLPAGSEDVSFRYVLSDGVTPAYDEMGNLLRVHAEIAASSSGGATYEMAYGYDARNRVASWAANGAVPLTYAYDRRGNLVEHAGQAQVFGVGRDPAHGIQSREDGSGAYTYAYDAAGNRASMTRVGVGTDHYRFDGRGRLVCIGTTSGSCDRLSVQYNGAGERFREVGSSTYHYAGPNFRMRPGASARKLGEYWIEIRALGQRVAYKHVTGGALRIVGVFP